MSRDLPDRLHVVRLPHSPGLLPAYVRAALPLPRAAATPGSEGVTLELTGLRPDPSTVDRYRAVIRHPGGDRLPLLYPHLLGFPLQLRLMSDRSFPFPALGLVHVHNVVTARRPILVGSPLDVRVHAEPVRPHPKGRVVDLVTVVCQDGEQVWTESSSYLRRGHGDGPDAAGSNGAQPAATLPDGEEPVLHQAAVWRLGGDLGRRYAAVSGDVNPIHLHPLTARALGFPRAIAHGMWTAASTVAALDGRLPDAVRYEVAFRRPILLPSTVRLFTAVTPDGARAEVRGRDGSDTVHLTATLTHAG